MNRVLKALVVAFMITINATTSFSQTYLNIPGNTISVNCVLEDTQTLSIEQHNNGTDTIQLKWNKISESVPANWDAYVCDNSICYPNLADSGTMLPIYPGDYGLLLIHCTAHLQPGIATIKYAVWDISNPTLRDTLTYSINAVSTGIFSPSSETINFILTDNELRLIGNLEPYTSMKLIDLNGKAIFTISLSGRNTFKIPTINTAAYIIQLTGKEETFQKKIINQP